jgi:hypothetical protein
MQKARREGADNAGDQRKASKINFLKEKSKFSRQIQKHENVHVYFWLPLT